MDTVLSLTGESAMASGVSRPALLPWETMGLFDMPALEGLASEPGSGQPELGPERPEALFDVFAPTESG
jgi:hypothetical protein